MKVLITGGMGVMGAETSRRFVHDGHRPIIFARHRDESLIPDILDHIDLELGDVLDLPRLMDVIKRHRITHVVHAAAFVGAVSQANPALSVQVNVMGMVNVLEAARLFDVKRVVYTSAKGVYGPVLGEYGSPIYKPMPEDLPKNPKRIYDSAKLMGEHVGLYYQANMGLDVVVLRFASTYGPGKTARHGKMGVMSQIVENPANGLPFHLAQGGDKKDDFVYNKDSAHGIYLATIAAQPKSRVYNIGTGVGVTLNDFARVIRQHLPQARIEIGPGLNVSRHTSAGLHSLAPAAKSRTPWRRSAARLRGAGLPSARPAYTGMGLASLEYPRYRHHALKADQGALEAIGDEFRPGMVFAFNIDLFDPKWRNGETGCVFAETIRITERGACRMHGYPTELQVLDV